MASRTFHTEGYNSGDSVYAVVRGVGRITSSGQHLYFPIVLDKRVISSAANITISVTGTQNIMPIGHSGATGGLSTSATTAASRQGNIVLASVPTVNSGLTVNSVYYIECSVNITFS